MIDNPHGPVNIGTAPPAALSRLPEGDERGKPPPGPEAMTSPHKRVGWHSLDLSATRRSFWFDMGEHGPILRSEELINDKS